MPPTKKFSKFETLADKLVNAVAQYLDNGDTMELRTTSKTMRDHLNSNAKLQACFRDLECPFTSIELLDLHKFMKTPLASAVVSLKLFKTDDTDDLDRFVAFDGLTPGVTQRGGALVIENPAQVRKHLKERPQRMFAELVNDLPNLKTVCFVCGEDLAQARAGSLRDPEPEDFEFLADALRRTTRTLNIDVCYEKGAVGLEWSGQERATHELWFEGYSSGSLLHPVTKTCIERPREPEDFFVVDTTYTLPVLGGHALQSLSLHRTVLSLADLRALTDARSVNGPLQNLIITQSEIYAGREGEEHRFFTHKKSPLKTSIRNLGLIRCLTLSVPWLKVFKALRKYTQLERLLFEKIVVPSGVVQFDWDGDGVLDDGSRLPSIQEPMDMNATLNKMIQCCKIPSSGSLEA
ncbi:hypothetical protein BC567DRAFT_287743 [Phyllosticta citribraziliensis]